MEEKLVKNDLLLEQKITLELTLKKIIFESR
jgi:hypothetical protein